MKTYSVAQQSYRWGTGSSEETREAKVLQHVRENILRTKALTDESKDILSKSFQKRSEQALALVDGTRVSRFQFSPSGRTVWMVTGRRDEYQVMPESMFCTCDDYYFRVMGRKKQLCYHLIAQQLAEALGKFRHNSLRDADYDAVTARWKPNPSR